MEANNRKLANMGRDGGLLFYTAMLSVRPIWIEGGYDTTGGVAPEEEATIGKAPGGRIPR